MQFQPTLLPTGFCAQLVLASCKVSEFISYQHSKKTLQLLARFRIDRVGLTEDNKV